MADTHAHHSADVIKAMFIGLIAVFVWGPSLPLAKIMTDKVALLCYIIMVNVFSGCFGILKNKIRKKRVFTPDILKNPILYIRWFGYVSYVTLTGAAISLVSHSNFSLLILINYLWPTSIIIWSIILSEVRITHRWALILGCVIVVSSLSFELLGPKILDTPIALLKTDAVAFGMIFISAVIQGLYIAIGRKYGHGTGGGAVIPYFQLTFALALPFYFASDAVLFWHMEPWVWGGLLALGFGFFVAHQSWNYGMQHGNVVALSLCADFIPWLSLISAHLFLHADITPTTMVAAFALVVGAMITRFGTL